MPNSGPCVLVQMTDEADCRFVAAWLIKAAETQDIWSDALKDSDFSDPVALLHIMGMPDLGACALEMVEELEHRRHVATFDLLADEYGLVCIELTLLVRLGFFFEVAGSYHMPLPQSITQAAVTQAALDLLTTAEDEGDYLKPERLLHTMAKTEADQLRSRLMHCAISMGVLLRTYRYNAS